jgi:hypothetical protein
MACGLWLLSAVNWLRRCPRRSIAQIQSQISIVSKCPANRRIALTNVESFHGKQLTNLRTFSACRQRRTPRRRRRRPEADRATAPRSAEAQLHEGTALGSLSAPRPRPATRPRRALGDLDGLAGVSGPQRDCIHVPYAGLICGWRVSHTGKPRACPALHRRATRAGHGRGSGRHRCQQAARQKLRLVDRSDGQSHH